MVTLDAYFDGKVFVPDEPFQFATNQKVRLQIETIDTVCAPKAHNPGDDEDALWEKGMLPKSTSL